MSSFRDVVSALLLRLQSALARLVSVLNGGVSGVDRRRAVTVLHRSDDFLVVDKEHDLVINSDDPERDSLYKRLAEQFAQLADFDKYKHGFGVCHRLDFATSGALVVPLTPRACRSASAAFEGRRAVKTYLALLSGIVNGGEDEILSIDRPVGGDPSPGWEGLRMSCAPDSVGPRPAVTKVVVLSRGVYSSGGGDCYPATKVLLRPVSGRRHQLRVHCSSLGHRIVGDFTYSDRRDEAPSRMFLHALRIVMPNKVEDLDVTADRGYEHDPFGDELWSKRRGEEYRAVREVRSLSEGYKVLDDPKSDVRVV